MKTITSGTSRLLSAVLALFLFCTMLIVNSGGIEAFASEYGRFDTPLQLKILLEDEVVFETTGQPGDSIRIPEIKTPTGYYIAGLDGEGKYTLVPEKDKSKKQTYEFTFADQSVTLKAMMKPNNYKIVFDKNTQDDKQSGITGKMTNITLFYDQEKKLPKNYLKREGYDFIGWNTQADGKGTMYADGAMVKNLTTEKGGTVTLYAVWGPEGSAPAVNSSAPSTTSAIFSKSSAVISIAIGILLIAIIAVIIFVATEKKRKQKGTKS